MTTFLQEQPTYRASITTRTDELTGTYDSDPWNGQQEVMSLDLSSPPYPVLDSNFDNMEYHHGWVSDMASTVITPNSAMVPSHAELFPSNDTPGVDMAFMENEPPLLVSSDPYWAFSPLLKTEDDYGGIESIVPHVPEQDLGASRSFAQSQIKAEPSLHTFDVGSAQAELKRNCYTIKEEKARRDESGRRTTRRATRKRTSTSATSGSAIKKRARRPEALHPITHEGVGITITMEPGLHLSDDGKLRKPDLTARKEKYLCGKILADGTRCPAKFQRAEHRKRHLDTTHAPQAIFPCVLPVEECDKSFTRQDNRRDHYKTHLENAQQPRNRRVPAARLFDLIRADPTENGENTVQKLRAAMALKNRSRHAKHG
jgi:hypothetical protein